MIYIINANHRYGMKGKINRITKTGTNALCVHRVCIKQLYTRLIPDTSDNSSKCLFVYTVYNTNVLLKTSLKKLCFNLIINKRGYSVKCLPTYKRHKIDMQNIAFIKLIAST